MSGTLCLTGDAGRRGIPGELSVGLQRARPAEGAQARSCRGSLDVVLWCLHRPPSSSSDSQAWSWTGQGVGRLWPPPPGTETPGSVWHMVGNRENSVVVCGAVALGAQEPRRLVPAVRLIPGDQHLV